MKRGLNAKFSYIPSREQYFPEGKLHKVTPQVCGVAYFVSGFLTSFGLKFTRKALSEGKVSEQSPVFGSAKYT